MVEVNKTVTITVQATTAFKWISGETVPDTPTGYIRATELDLDFGILGKLWGFLKVD